MSPLQSDQPFEWPVRVYYEDTDAQGVVYYGNYFRFLERARTEWLRALGVDQVALLEVERRIFVVTEMHASFVAPARFNDELLVTASLGNLSPATIGIEQNIYRGGRDGALIFRASVKAAYLDADTMKPRRVPASIFEEVQP